MKPLIALLATFTTLACAGNIYARTVFYDGNRLKQLGQAWDKVYSDPDSELIEQDANDLLQYGSYVTGVFDTANEVSFCASPEITKVKILRIVYRYLTDHPEKWNEPASDSVVNALKAAFPCKAKK